MIQGFGAPPLAASNRSLVAERIGELRATGGIPETLRVEFRGQALTIEVIDMPVAQLYYNPGTHRIRAQRSHDPERDRELELDPWSDESQAYLNYLLSTLPADPSKRDPDFDKLKDSLREHRQIEPGLITYDGILVNGNTRRAALRELGVPTIRVGVLPATSTWEDIDAVELTLQLRPDTRREYSYINHLLAVDEQRSLGRSMSDIARDFHTTAAVCERDVWILAELRELLRRSAHGEFSLRLMDFEDAKEKLFELHRAYMREKSREKAELLKESRLAAIAFGFAKTDVRYITPEFQARFLEQRLPEELKLDVVTSVAVVSIPGLNRSVPAVGQGVATARAVTDTVLKLKSVEVAGHKAEPSRLADASNKKAALKDAFDEAIEYAGRDFRMRKKRQAAPDRVTDACKDLDQCVTDIVMARGSGSLDEEAFDDALLKLRDTLKRLAAEAATSIEIPGEGLTWLRGASGTGER